MAEKSRTIVFQMVNKCGMQFFHEGLGKTRNMFVGGKTKTEGHNLVTKGLRFQTHTHTSAGALIRCSEYAALVCTPIDFKVSRNM